MATKGQGKTKGRKRTRSERVEKYANATLQKNEDGEVELPPISKREHDFVIAYIQRYNAADAVKAAGIESADPSQFGYNLLSRSDIQQHVTAERKKIGELHYDLSNQVLHQYNRMRLADPTTIYDADGNLLDPAEWPDDVKLLLKGIEIEERMVGEGDAQEMVRTKKVHFTERKAVLDSMNKVLGTFKENIDHTSGGKPLDMRMQPVINITTGVIRPDEPNHSGEK
jgi:hypothetical protein